MRSADNRAETTGAAFRSHKSPRKSSVRHTINYRESLNSANCGAHPRSTLSRSVSVSWPIDLPTLAQILVSIRYPSRLGQARGVRITNSTSACRSESWGWNGSRSVGEARSSELVAFGCGNVQVTESSIDSEEDRSQEKEKNRRITRGGGGRGREGTVGTR